MRSALSIVFLAGLGAAGAAKDGVPESSIAAASPVRAFALRLRPGDDLKKELQRFARENELRAGAVVTCVGSLTRAVIRLADQPEATTFDGKHEIVSLVGTLGADGEHLHIAVSDSAGRTIGGHLMEGSLVYTTAEIVIGELTQLRFTRETDPATTYKELKVRKR